jgi:hypothetical protein
MYRRAIIASTPNLEAFYAVSSWRESQNFDALVIGNVYDGVATIVLRPASNGEQLVRELLLKELRKEPGVWTVNEVEYQG